MSLRSLACPSCGAPVRWPRGAEEASCLHCTQILVRDAGGDRLRAARPDGGAAGGAGVEAALGQLLETFDDVWRTRFLTEFRTDVVRGSGGRFEEDMSALAVVVGTMAVAAILLIVPISAWDRALVPAGVVIVVGWFARWDARARRRTFEDAYGRYQRERLELIRRVRAATAPRG